MKNNRNIIKVFFFFLFTVSAVLIFLSCGVSKATPEITDTEKQVFASKVADTVEISNSESDYRIIIIEPGFNFWLQSVARPEGYYSQNFLENRNRFYVVAWNNRVINTFQNSRQLYQFQIDYDPMVDYGYEVNYKLYNYFIYFQRKYNQRLGPFAPRI